MAASHGSIAVMSINNVLIDCFGRQHSYLRISVTDRCNLRCFYCMPRQGLVWRDKAHLLTYEEIERVARIFVEMGITKIRLTGGEPLVRKGLPNLARRLKQIDGLQCLAMTTNATLLAEHAADLRAGGMDALNISLDTFDRAKFERITYQDKYDVVMDGIKAALQEGFDTIKINMVAIAGVNDDEILDFARFALDNPVNVRFIEFMPFKDNDWDIQKVITYQEIKEKIEKVYRLQPRVIGDAGFDTSAVAKDFAMVDGKGWVSFISSMSDSFCSTCNRLRLTADGSIKSCLFAPSEINMRERLREGATDDDIRDMILYSLSRKPEAHPPAAEIAAQENRAMIQIGG